MNQRIQKLEEQYLPVLEGDLTMTDTSSDEQHNTEIELFLTRENLNIVFDRGIK
jgi:hypothetical protein